MSLISRDSGDIGGLSCPIEKMIYFKPGAPVMVLYNINQNIQSGVQGIFVRKIDENSAVVKIDRG